MKYGIRDGVLRQPLDQVFGVAAELGFDGVEVCIGKGYRDSILWQPDGPERLGALAAAAKIEICSLSPGIYASLNASLPDAEKRAEGQALLEHLIQVCSELEIPDILVPMFPKDVNNWHPERWDLMVTEFKKLAVAAEEQQVALNFETTFTGPQLAAVLDLIGCDCLQAYFDTANTMAFGMDVPAEVRTLGLRIGMVHAKDSDGKMLGEGKVDFNAVAEAIREIGYDGYIVLETPAGNDPSASAARNLAFVKELFGDDEEE